MWRDDRGDSIKSLGFRIKIKITKKPKYTTRLQKLEKKNSTLINAKSHLPLRTHLKSSQHIN